MIMSHLHLMPVNFLSFPNSGLMCEREGGEGEDTIRAPGIRAEKGVGHQRNPICFSERLHQGSWADDQLPFHIVPPVSGSQLESMFSAQNVTP